jgi:type II secretory pathway pseudopilin PulG
VDWIKCITNRLLRGARREAGITLIETVLAIAIFGIVSTSLIGVLTSATAADSRARQKTIALELAQQQIEYVRQLGYADVCIAGGNPSCPVTVPATVGVTPTLQKRVMGLWYQLRTSIRWVNDAVATGVATGANYKRVRVIVTRLTDNKELARSYALVANPSNRGVGGINNAIINVSVLDFGCTIGDGCTTNSNPVYVLGAQVDLWDGPSMHASDVTDETGAVTFAGLTPNPADSNGVLLPSGAMAYYDILASAGGYQTLREDIPPGTVPSGTGAAPATATHLQLNPGQTQSANIRLYRPATINVLLKNVGGSTYTGNAYVDIGATSPRCAQEFPGVVGGSLSIVPPTGTIGSTETILCSGGEQPVSGISYTVGARSTDGTLAASAVQKSVPNSYPNDLTSTFVLTLEPTTSVNCTVTVKKGSSYIQGARVDFVDTPGGDVETYATGVTNTSGVATFTKIPTGVYDIKVWSNSGNGGPSGVTVPSSSCNFIVSL